MLEKDIFANVVPEGTPVEGIVDLEEKKLGDEEEKETPAESQTDKKPENEEKKEEGKEEEKKIEKEEEDEEKIPFHKHPRFKALVEEKNHYKEELEKFKEETDQKLRNIEEKTTGNAIPEWFVEVFGENEVAWNKYQQASKSDREALKAEIREEIKGEYSKKESEEKKWSEWIETQVEELKDNGLKFDKNKLLKVMDDYRPMDEAGNLDFKKGYKIYEALNQKDPEEKKQIKKMINSDGTKTGEEPKKRDYKTPQDIKGWR